MLFFLVICQPISTSNVLQVLRQDKLGGNEIDSWKAGLWRMNSNKNYFINEPTFSSVNGWEWTALGLFIHFLWRPRKTRVGVESEMRRHNYANHKLKVTILVLIFRLMYPWVIICFRASHLKGNYWCSAVR